MKKEEMERAVLLFTEIQECTDKRIAFLKGALFGIGFIDIPEPNWNMIKKVAQEGDPANWIEIEKQCLQIHRKVRQDQIDLMESMLREKNIEPKTILPIPEELRIDKANNKLNPDKKERLNE